MNIKDAQREVRSVYLGGFVGQLVSSAVWFCERTSKFGHWKGGAKSFIKTKRSADFLVRDACVD